MEQNNCTRWHTPTHAKFVSGLVCSLLLGLIGWGIPSAVHQWQIYKFENAPIEQFYKVMEFRARDVDVTKGTEAEIELIRNAAGDYLANAGLTLEGIALKDTAVCCAESFGRKQTTIPISIERGEKSILIQQDLHEWFAEGHNEAQMRGVYQWVFDMEITLPFGVTRRVTFTSNTFKVSNEPVLSTGQL